MGKPARKYDPGDFEAQYDDCLSRRGASSNPAGLGTLVWYARQGGWPGKIASYPEWLERMNQRYAFIEKERRIYRLEFGDFTTPQDFRQQHCNELITVQTKDEPKQKEIGDQWLRHRQRRQHKQLVMRPNGPPVTADDRLNTWKGFAVKLAPGDIKPFFRLLKRLFPDTETRAYVLQWLAHLLQHPECKMHVALVIWSRQQGVGKNLLFETFLAIIGQHHSILIGQSELARDFNGWVKNKIFVIGDEVSGDDKRQHADKIKGLVTSNSIQINEKHQPAYEANNLLSFVFLSNHPTAIFLNDADRRYFVVEIEADPLPASEADAYVNWRDNGGLAALLDKMLEIDLKAFNPKARAPDTDAKRQMIDDNRSELEAWAESLMGSDPATLIGREMATAAELASRYSTETERPRPSEKAVTQAFKRVGARAPKSQPKLPSGRKVRPLALTRQKYWAARPGSDWASEMEKPFKY